MCGLMQFVVSTNSTEKFVEHLAKYFMVNVILSFSMVMITVVDSDSWFKRILKYMCADLGIIYWTLARANHKGKSVEKYHHFLKKAGNLGSRQQHA